MLKHFKINTERDLLVSKLVCYQLDLMGAAQAAIKAGMTSEDFKELPSWTKVAANPIKAQGFITKLFLGLFMGQGSLDELNIAGQVKDAEGVDINDAVRVALMFLPGNMKSTCIKEFGNLVKNILPNWEVFIVNGSQKYHGVGITNKNVEGFVKEVVAKGKNTLIISAQMAQRSFSIPEITELYLAYDGGQIGSTIQKVSRTLTPEEESKVGRVFSLSFDPNRDDKFDPIVLETAYNYHKSHAGVRFSEAVLQVLRTIDIYSCEQAGPIKMNRDQYIEAAMARKSISKVIGKTVNLTKLSAEDIHALANADMDYFRAAKVAVAPKGKTKEKLPAVPKGENAKKNQSIKDLEKARTAIVTIMENLDIILLGTGSKTVVEALQILDSPEGRAWVLEDFGVDLDVITFLFEQDIINQRWVDILFENA